MLSAGAAGGWTTLIVVPIDEPTMILTRMIMSTAGGWMTLPTTAVTSVATIVTTSLGLMTKRGEGNAAEEEREDGDTTIKLWWKRETGSL